MSTTFSMGTMAEESVKPQWIPLKENLYTLEVFDVKEEMTPSYNDPTVNEQTLSIMFKVKSAVDGSPVVDMNGDIPASDLLRVGWINPKAIGFNRKTNKPHKLRSILTALMGVPVEAAVTLKSWDELIGKQCKAYVSLVPKADGTKSNKVENFSSLKA